MLSTLVNTLFIVGSFGQLLTSASAGALYQPNYNLGNCSNESTELQQGYEAGEDSAYETEAGEDSASEHEGQDTDHEHGSEDSESIADEQPLNQCSFDIDDDIAVDIDDNIADYRFHNRGIDGSDYEGPRGIDDTALYETEVEVVEEVGDKEVEIVEAVDGQEGSSDGVDTDIHEDCLLGGCGCSIPEIAQEISTQYLESEKAGYKKR